MTCTTDNTDSVLCQCDDPDPGSENQGTCENCQKTIGQAVIGGEVHAGYTTLGNGQKFFNAKENVHLDQPHRGVIAKYTTGEYYADLSDLEVVCPHSHRSARLHGTQYVSIDHLIQSDGSVEVSINATPLEELP